MEIMVIKGCLQKKNMVMIKTWKVTINQYRVTIKHLKGDGKKRSSDLPFMPAPEKVKERRGNKNTTSKKILIRLPVLLAQIGAGNNSCKPKKGLGK